MIRDQAGLLLWIAFKIVQDTEQAFDCVMDALKQACQRLQKYSPEQMEHFNVRAWLQTIVRNEAIDAQEREKQLQKVSLEQIVEEHGSDDPLWYPTSRENVSQQPEMVFLQQEVCRRFAVVFSLLPPRQARAIWSHFLEQQPHSTTAREFGISEKGANMLSSRGVKALREGLLREHLRHGDFQLGQLEGLLTQILLGEEDSA